MNPIPIDAGVVNARDIAEAWFLNLMLLWQRGFDVPIQRGSFEKEQKRRQIGLVCGSIAFPYQGDVIPSVPEGVPVPTSIDYINKYVGEKLLSKSKANEAYTYGDRIAGQVEPIVQILRETPYTNQAIIQIARPEDLDLKDPPCLRSISFKCRPNPKSDKPIVDVCVYFRSWDAWAGFPTNMGGIMILADTILSFCPNLTRGTITYFSDGLHYYSMHEPYVMQVLRKQPKGKQLVLEQIGAGGGRREIKKETTPPKTHIN